MNAEPIESVSVWRGGIMKHVLFALLVVVPLFAGEKWTDSDEPFCSPPTARCCPRRCLLPDSPGVPQASVTVAPDLDVDTTVAPAWGAVGYDGVTVWPSYDQCTADAQCHLQRLYDAATAEAYCAEGSCWEHEYASIIRIKLYKAEVRKYQRRGELSRDMANALSEEADDWTDLMRVLQRQFYRTNSRRQQ